ncbi:MAG: prepilin-type N-terminal cleavage/methylation domain-containing protein [Pseudomonadota bacterium]
MQFAENLRVESTRMMSKEKTKPKFMGGYTIVELMMVMIIIAIGATIAAASIMESKKNTLLTDVTRETINVLRTARHRALLRNVAIGISIINSNPTTATIRIDESTDTSCANIAGPANAFLYDIMNVTLNAPRWRGISGANIYMSGLSVGNAPTSVATLCLNRRGRVLMNAGGAWVNILGTPALEIQYQRQDEGVDMGVARVIRMEQGGVSRIVR